VQDTGSDPCGNNLPISGVTASGNDGNVPQNVLDNNLATRWSSNGIGQFITADLGTAQSVCGVGIAWYRGNERISHFVISTSTDGTTFTPRFSGDSSGTTLNSEKYTFTTAVNARYVRVTVNGNTANTWASITELDVFGPSNPPTGVLWDSNVDGKWNNGTMRTITTKQNGQQPCDKSIFVAASGNPKLVIDGNGIAHLVGGSGGVDNLSLKLRSRHQAGGEPENRAGGEGIAITNSSFSCQRENYHNVHDTIKNGSLPKSFTDNKWFKIKFSCKDESAGKIRLKASIDYLDGQGYKEFMNVVDSGAPDYFFNKNMFKALSWFWVRLNNADNPRIYVCACNYDAELEGEYMFEDSKNSIAMRNIRLTAL
jgi:F5/8 type C domain